MSPPAIDPTLLAAQQSAAAALSSAHWAAATFWVTMFIGMLSVVVNGVLAWLAYDGPPRQRHADRQLADRALQHEAAKTVNLHLGGLQVCRNVYAVADEIVKAAMVGGAAAAGTILRTRPDLIMHDRLLEYFLQKDIADADVVHLLMKTRDAALNLQQAAANLELATSGSGNAVEAARRMAEHVLAQCAEERQRVEKRVREGSAFISDVTGAMMAEA